MKNCFWNEVTLRRLNHGKKSPSEIQNERDRQRLKTLVAGLVAKWRSENSAEQDQTRTQIESANTMTTNEQQKNRLRGLIHRELRSTFRDWTQWAPAADAVLKKHPELKGAKAELSNEFKALPSPVQFQQELAEMTTKNGGNRDLAFRALCERYPLLSPQFSNQLNDDDAQEQRERREQLQKLIRQYCKEQGFDLAKPGIYDLAFKRVLQKNPELANAMHKPGRANANRWIPTASDGHTPAKARKATAREYGTGAPPTRRADMAV
jgi:hypothetical protein